MISVLELCFMAFIGEVEPRQKLSLCQTIHGGSQASNSQELFLPYWLTNILYLVSGLTCFGFPFFLHFLAKQLWDCWGVLYNWQFPIFIFFSLQVHWSHCKYILNIGLRSGKRRVNPPRSPNQKCLHKWQVRIIIFQDWLLLKAEKEIWKLTLLTNLH